MKKNYITIIAALLLGVTVKSQQTVGFEDLTLATDTFWNGSDLSGQFISNTVVFKNEYAGYWKGGFAYSNNKDITTAGYTNSYSCIKGEGAGSSANYAVFTNLDTTAVTLPAGNTFDGFWINNSTYAYLSMKNGDGFAKKFGDSLSSTGVAYPSLGNDWFKLSIYGENNDSVEFYLADFRGPDSTDYIIKDWTYISLAGLDRSSKKISFKLTSSDTGNYGMNTPGYFCMDSLGFSRHYVGTNELEAMEISVYPNPTKGNTKVNFEDVSSGSYSVYSYSGALIRTEKFSSVSNIDVDLSKEENGMYILSLNLNDKIITKKILKN